MPTSKNYLLDVNCWLDAAAAPLIFCRVTQMAFLRLVTNPKVMGADVLTPRQAWETYRKFRADPRIIFAEEPPELEKAWLDMTDTAGFKQDLWTDSYLAAFAVAGGCAIVTFDDGFRQFLRIDVIVLPGTPESGKTL
ncbi:MAG TPA: TA system VapC family ribonuclease toxin [Verrucomicrobiae bacterium]|nr:TA system VapC family ribonuclease toxin [Verrucomicrobiae bacterium]